MVRFTPNGWSVISRQRLISLLRSSGVGWVSPVRMPSAPALDTAAANSARPTPCMPPCTIGCLMANISVKRVLIILSPPGIRSSISERGTTALALGMRFRGAELAVAGQCADLLGQRQRSGEAGRLDAEQMDQTRHAVLGRTL